MNIEMPRVVTARQGRKILKKRVGKGCLLSSLIINTVVFVVFFLPSKIGCGKISSCVVSLTTV